MASTYLSRTQTSGNRATMTASFWIKRTGNIGEYNHIFTNSPNPGNWDTIRFDNDNQLSVRINNDSYVLKTSREFVDTSAWYHFVVTIDTTNATESDRVKIWVNGERETLFASSTYPTLNYDTNFNLNSQTMRIGANTWAGDLTVESLQANVSNFIWVDGTAYDADFFGEFDATTGIWKHKASTPTFGTNGFFLKFSNSGNLGEDSSGNTNNLTVSGSPTQIKDTPTNNWCILNYQAQGTNRSTLSLGNLKMVSSTGAYHGTAGTIQIPTSGKWYFEYKFNTTADGGSTEGVIGVARENKYNEDQNKNELFETGYTQYWNGGSFSSGDIAGVLVDRDAAEVKIYKNDSLLSTKTSAIAEPYFVWASAFGSGTNGELNTGNPHYSISSSNSDPAGLGSFEYDTKGGYAICTKNINTYG